MPRRCPRMFAALDALPVPVIGRVHGAALGGGAGLAAVCDIVVAEEQAVFGFTEVKLGILPAVISPFVARQDRPVGGARAVSDRRALLGRARAGDRARARRRAGRRARSRPSTATSGRFSTAGPEAIAAAKALIARRLRDGRSTRRAPITAQRHRRPPRVARRPGGAAGVPREAAALAGRAPAMDTRTTRQTDRRRSMIRRLLIANRGEIAVRIIARLPRAGHRERRRATRTPTRTRAHVAAADRRGRHRPGAGARELPVDCPRSCAAAQASGADAVHPGYGFLSENAAFAAACEAAGLIFVGPPADVIARMGSKIEARRLMQQAGVPVVPGETPADQSDAGIAQAIERVGLPVARQGVGGRRRQGHARASREPSDDRRGGSGGAARGAGRVRRRHALRRAAASSGRVTSKSRSSATRTATSCTCSSANARCSGGIRK